MDGRIVLSAVLVVHVAVAGVHGVTHSLVPVYLSVWVNAVVAVTTFLGPLAGVALRWRGHPLGVPLFTLSLAVALLVGGVLHFGFENPDHVHAIPASQWRLPFQGSAAGVAVTEGVGTVVGSWYWYTR